ncbi:MAG: glycosyltransferase family 2 protein [Pyrinomonadaceae bacterium]|nr:glycosyltransferase family 2 protein [Pyrinomonadaceae bacterium]
MNAVSDSLIDAPISPECLVSIVIPVRDEAENLAVALDAFVVQVDLQNRPLDSNIFEIIVLANNCRDNSAQTARDWQKRNSPINLHVAEIALPLKLANIGFFRRLLMNEAFRRLQSNNFQGGIIATTDGDTRVAPDWISQNMSEIENGADAVGGRILMEAAELEKMDERARYFHLRDEEYHLLAAEYECYLDEIIHDVFPRHHQHFNGSFAVKTGVFKRAGGIPEVEFLEDIAFYNALLRIDAKFRHSPSVKVFTSSRHLGRSAVGLSFQLNEWKKLGETGADFLVEAANALEKKFLARKKLRGLWFAAKSNDFPNPAAVSALAETLCVPSKFVSDEISKPQTFGNLLEKIYERQQQNRRWHQQNPPVAVEAAIAGLKFKLENSRSANLSFKIDAR